MTASQAIAFFKSRGKTVLTFFGYSGQEYENENIMLQIAQATLTEYSTKDTLVNIGATSIGIGAVYPLAKSMGFETTGIVATKALLHPEGISATVDHVCFVEDNQYGGKLPNSDELSPTSIAMVACSDILVAIGGGRVSRDELLAAKAQGKPVYYHPAEVNHECALRVARQKGMPPPDSFWGSVHDALGK
jgi:hypothetical protein